MQQATAHAVPSARTPFPTLSIQGMPTRTLWPRQGLALSVDSSVPHISSEGEQRQFLGLLPSPFVKSSCFPLPFYRAESYPDAWVQHTLWLNSECNLTVLDGLSQPCHNLSTGSHSENFLLGSLFSSSFWGAWPQVAWPHSLHLGMSSKGRNTTCHPNLYTFPWRAGNLYLPIILQVPC